jgi:hypothetical protein
MGSKAARPPILREGIFAPDQQDLFYSLNAHVYHQASAPFLRATIREHRDH